MVVVAGTITLDARSTLLECTSSVTGRWIFKRGTEGAFALLRTKPTDQQVIWFMEMYYAYTTDTQPVASNVRLLVDIIQSSTLSRADKVQLVGRSHAACRRRHMGFRVIRLIGGALIATHISTVMQQPTVFHRCLVLLDSCNATATESVYATDWDPQSSVYVHSSYRMNAIKNTNVLSSSFDTMFALAFDHHNMVRTAVQNVMTTVNVFDMGPETIFNTTFDYHNMVSTVVHTVRGDDSWSAHPWRTDGWW